MSSDFDSAASSFIARMEQSVMEDHLKLQQQKRQQHLLNQFLMNQTEADVADTKNVNVAPNTLSSGWPVSEEAAFKKAPAASILLPRVDAASLGVSTGLPVGGFPPHMLPMHGSVMQADMESDDKKAKRYGYLLSVSHPVVIFRVEILASCSFL